MMARHEYDYHAGYKRSQMARPRPTDGGLRK